MKNIWTNGCFDILHIGHIELLRYAKNLGDRLIVGVDSDFRIKKYKYPNSNRPINNETDRIEFLKSIKYIDEVHLFQDHDHMRQLIKSYQIDTIVVGDDYKLEQVVGRELVKNVVLFPKIIDKSSSNLIQLLK